MASNNDLAVNAEDEEQSGGVAEGRTSPQDPTEDVAATDAPAVAATEQTEAEQTGIEQVPAAPAVQETTTVTDSAGPTGDVTTPEVSASEVSAQAPQAGEPAGSPASGDGVDGAASGAAASGEPAADASTDAEADPAPQTPAPTRRRSTRSRTTKKAAAPVEGADSESGDAEAEAPAPVKRARSPRKRAASKRAATAAAPEAATTPAESTGDAAAEQESPAVDALFEQPAAPVKKTTRRRSTRKASAPATTAAAPPAESSPTQEQELVPAAASVQEQQEPAVAGTDLSPVTPPVESQATVESQPVAEESEQPSAEPTEQPVAEQIAPEPVAAEPVAGEPVAGEPVAAEPVAPPVTEQAPAPVVAVVPRTRPRTRVRTAAERAAEAAALEAAQAELSDADTAEATSPAAPTRPAIMPIFQAPEPVAPRPRRAASRPAGPPKPAAEETPAPEPEVNAEGEDDVTSESPEEFVTAEFVAAESGQDESSQDESGQDEIESESAREDEDGDEDSSDGDEQETSTPRRRRRRGGRGRRGRSRGEAGDQPEPAAAAVEESPAEESEAGADDVEPDDDGEDSNEPTGSRRRRRRRRRGSGGTDGEVSVDDGTTVVTKVRDGRRSGGDDVVAVRGSTRLEAKKQRRREGREAGRRRTILSEAEFLARRESVERQMVVRERDGRTQIGVLEDGVLVEHYVARKTQTSTVGNVYLGRVQNVLPSMEAAFIDIGKGRNAVLYAGEVNWDAAGLDGQPRRIEHALKAGDSVLVQVTKDPIGHKGARLTSQISMPGRYLVYVPDGSMTGISRKLPDTERSRLKKILREVVPDNAGVIVRTAAEGASDEELERDVARLQSQWETISAKVATASAPAMLYGEPDLAIKVVRDVFNEDFGKLTVSGDEAWQTIEGYISHVAPDLAPRLEHWQGEKDVFAKYRIDEQLAKGLDRKVWLPSGGSLVIDRTEAMTVIDVNTGKFTGAGGNLEETVTKNNLEAAEEVVHQLRLRDIGGIIVVDFIDMVLESNRDLVLRRLLECLGRDRTRHQVAEVTSLGLVQMTRKRVGQGLVEVFSETCEHCGGRGLIMHDEPVEKKQQDNGGGGRKGRNNHH